AAALAAFAAAPASLREPHRDAIRRARAFLAREVDAQGAVVGDGTAIDYPNYSAAMLLLALAELGEPAGEPLSGRLVARRRRVQLGPARGLAADDPAAGGVDLGASTAELAAAEVPTADLSTTTWVLEGLRAAGVPVDDPLVIAARGF